MTPYCPFCIHARRLLDSKNHPYETIDVSRNPALRAEMIQKAKWRTSVPQIWIGEQHIGGCDELMALERMGKLDPLLQA